MFFRKKKKIETLEEKITGGKAKCIRTVKFEQTNKILTLEILRDYYHPNEIEKIVIFHDVENFSWEDLYPDDEPVDWENEIVIEDMIGLDEKLLPAGKEYCIHTEYREFIFTTLKEPEIIIKSSENKDVVR